jgi:prepilin-type N-terminal cleavage/methylation domain-containing protein
MLVPRDRSRPGYTLIELLVVIAIIATLISLTTAAVMKVLGRGAATQARAEITQLEIALATCRTDFGLDAVPSRLVLREDGRYDGPGPNSADYPRTMALLQKMFGRHFRVLSPYDWNGNGTIDSGEVVLEGQHCLVFLLGGIPTSPGSSVGCTGFNTDSRNPATPGGKRAGPYFEFKPGRLRRDPDAGNFLVYLDPWREQPYAYFSATKAGNDYTPDCPSLGVAPYFARGGQFLNPNGCQIISAGPDRRFGPGGLWNPATGGGGPNGADDISNFSRGALGGPQQ